MKLAAMTSYESSDVADMCICRLLSVAVARSSFPDQRLPESSRCFASTGVVFHVLSQSEIGTERPALQSYKQYCA